MFKKILLSVLLVFGMAAVASARDEISRDASVLPEAARTTIANNFKAKVSLVKIDKDFGRVSEYEVILTDGSEISFDSKGNWRQVETNAKTAVPRAFVVEGIRNFVKKNHAGQNVVGIEKERNGFEVELANGIDLKFDMNGNFIKYDD